MFNELKSSFSASAAFLLALTFVSAPLVADLTEDFSSASMTGGGAFLSGEGEQYVDNWDDGLQIEAAYAGSDGRVNSAVATVLSNAGPRGDNAASLTIDVDTATTTYWYAGIIFNANKLSSRQMDKVMLSIDVKAPKGKAFQVRVESSLGNFVAFNGVGKDDGGFQTIRGLLAEAEVTSGRFNPDAEVKVIVSFRNEQSGWKTGGTLTVDNLNLTSTESL